AVQVEKTHLSRDESTPANTGAIYEPNPDTATVDGGWHGAARKRRRGLVLGAALVAGGALATRALRR
ncbi:MAG TPA: hypothetical protein VIL55_12495, partial [Naasia sp.]